MPEGIVATVEDGYATLDFVDVTKRGPALQALIELAGPDSIETITRRGPRRQYRVLVDNADAVGLLDGDEVARPRSAGNDSGARDALVAADPNVNPGEDNANWHQQTTEVGTRNTYVGATTSAEERAMTPPRFTGTATPFGGSSAADTPTHAEVIEHVKGHRVTPSQWADPTDLEHSGAAANLRLASIQSVESTDPQGATILPGDKVALATTEEPVDDGETDTGAGASEPLPVETTTGDRGPRPDGLPEGEPNADWLRPQLETYATWIGLDNPSGYPNKTELLTAIENKEQS
ncbi:hypothetical protein I5G59_gp15 [Mycobacterium phage LilMcDreamy]|uniref:Uncharacterized protein n=1 Tax=Mycobacterium phage LilMcDreamy TaxID=2652422 RepID=A0A5P8D6G7_9CAUD|nr:hypothetical protein I5G59_gp15 [Mycobacterium phage LilMcDreamy]QFP94635.1 hypothetical protein SEA_LILMCDREAMY_15 [Mycobacterium phage LilMcDreamy]